VPSFKYFATLEESLAIVGSLLDQELTVIAEPSPFERPDAPEFSEVNDELVRIVNLNPSFFLRGRFTRFQVAFLRCQNGPAAGKYLIDFITAGPLLRCTLSRIGTMDGSRYVLPGTISYQKSYKNPETGEWDRATTELKTAYKKAIASIKRSCPELEQRRGVFIAKEARALADAGEVAILA
jgi:hypothetical protein